MIAEEFKDVKGYEGLYEVSNYGRVRSLMDCNGQARTLVLKPKKHRCGYLRVGLCKDGKQKFYSIHRLVAMAFIPNPDNLPQVNHKDECKTNNIVTNLEWCDAAYNTNYGTAIKRRAEKRINHPNLSKRVYQYTLDGSFVRSYTSTHEAARQTGISQGNIWVAANNNRLKSAGGYRWSYTPLIPKGRLFLEGRS